MELGGLVVASGGFDHLKHVNFTVGGGLKPVGGVVSKPSHLETYQMGEGGCLRTPLLVHKILHSTLAFAILLRYSETVLV